MDGIDILIYAFIFILAVVAIFSIILAFLPDGPDYSPNTGSDSLGNWTMVSTSAGVYRSYYFRSPLVNNEGKYLDINLTDKSLKFGSPLAWNFDGLNLFTASTGGFYYVNVTEGNIIYLSKEIISTWIYDGYNFYLNASLATDYVKILDPITLQIRSISKFNWTPYEMTANNWRPTDPFS